MEDEPEEEENLNSDGDPITPTQEQIEAKLLKEKMEYENPVGKTFYFLGEQTKMDDMYFSDAVIRETYLTIEQLKQEFDKTE
jgi:hypothetical protein